MCEIVKEDDPSTLEEIPKNISNSFILYQLCTSNKSAQFFSYIYGIITMGTKNILNENQSIDAIGTWGIILPLFNAIVEYKRNPTDQWNVKILETLFNEFSLNEKKGIGKILIEGNVYMSKPEIIYDEFYHFVNLSFAQKDNVLIKSVEKDDRFWSSETTSITFKEKDGDERLFAFLRALFYVLIRFYFPKKEERIRIISEDLLTFSKNWYEIKYTDNMKDEFDNIRKRVEEIHDIEMRFSISYLRKILTNLISEKISFLFPINTIKFIAYPAANKLNEKSIEDIREITKNFIELGLNKDISLKFYDEIIKWLDFNKEKLTDIQEDKFNIFYIKYIYDEIYPQELVIRQEKNIPILFEFLKNYTQLITDSIIKLSNNITISEDLQPGLKNVNPFIGTYDILNIVQIQYSFKDDIPKYDNIFTDQFNLVFKNKFLILKKLIQSLFNIEDYPNTLVDLFQSIDEAQTIQINQEKIVILIIYSAPSTITRFGIPFGSIARKLNMYIKRPTKFTIINFSGDLTGILEDEFPENIENDINIISKLLKITQQTVTLRLDIEIYPNILSSEVQNNSLIWIIWYTECVLRGFNEDQIKQFFKILKSYKYERYIRTDYYQKFIFPKLPK